jgi:hypothetical protein
MAIDYVIGVQCEAKRVIGVEQLVVLNRSRIIARVALEHARADGDQRPESQIPLQLATGAAGGPSFNSTTIGELKSASSALDAHGEECKTCPAAPRRLPFECHQRISYPISEDAEEWLMSRMPKDVTSAASSLLLRGVEEFKWTGGPVAKLRSKTGEYLESRVPYGVRWTVNDKPVEVSSDQILQLMFYVGHLAPTHCLMIALFCGAVDHSASFHDLKDPVGRAKLLQHATVAPESIQSIEQIAQFIRTVATAARLEVPVFIDG